jgi:hypothetical protein
LEELRAFVGNVEHGEFARQGARGLAEPEQGVQGTDQDHPSVRSSGLETFGKVGDWLYLAPDQCGPFLRIGVKKRLGVGGEVV